MWKGKIVVLFEIDIVDEFFKRCWEEPWNSQPG